MKRILVVVTIIWASTAYAVKLNNVGVLAGLNNYNSNIVLGYKLLDDCSHETIFSIKNGWVLGVTSEMEFKKGFTIRFDPTLSVNDIFIKHIYHSIIPSYEWPVHVDSARWFSTNLELPLTVKKSMEFRGVHPYVLLGIGLEFRLDDQEAISGYALSKTNINGCLGLGLQFQIWSNISAMAEARYSYRFTNGFSGTGALWEAQNNRLMIGSVYGF